MRSPLEKADGPVCFDLKIAGQSIADDVQVLSIHVEGDAGQPATATVIVQDGNILDDEFPLIDGTEFLPGNRISIALCYGSNPWGQVFQGRIKAQRLTLGEGTESLLHLGCQGEIDGATEGIEINPGGGLISFDAVRTSREPEGEVRCQGVAEAPGSALKLSGLGQRFSGTFQISGVNHRVEAGRWETVRRFRAGD